MRCILYSHNSINVTLLFTILFQYQRWLYPVDKTRFDDGTNQIAIVELVELDTNAVNEENNGKLTKKTKKAKKID